MGWTPTDGIKICLMLHNLGLQDQHVTPLVPGLHQVVQVLDVSDILLGQGSAGLGSVTTCTASTFDDMYSVHALLIPEPQETLHPPGQKNMAPELACTTTQCDGRLLGNPGQQKASLNLTITISWCWFCFDLQQGRLVGYLKGPPPA